MGKMSCKERAERRIYGHLERLNWQSKRLLISRFQVRVLGGSLLKCLQIAGKRESPAELTGAFDTSLTLTDSSLSNPKNSSALGTGISSPLSVLWLGSPSRVSRLLRLSAISAPSYYRLS